MKPFMYLKGSIDKVDYTIKLDAKDIGSHEEVRKNFDRLISLAEKEFRKSKVIKYVDDDKSIQGVRFENGLWITYPSHLSWGWSRINFCADQIDLKKLEKIFSKFPLTFTNNNGKEQRTQILRDV